MVERSDYASTRIGETLPPAIRKPLVSLGVWDQFLADRHAASYVINSAWGRSALQENDSIFNPYGAGWHVDRPRFDAMLAGAAEEAGATVLRRIRSFHCSSTAANEWKVRITSCDLQSSFRAKFLVDATGRGSALARKNGATRVICDHLIGAVAFLPASPGASIPFACTLIEATEEGWWYSAGLPDSRVVVAFMTDADIYARAARSSPRYWREQLRRSAQTQLRVAPSALTLAPQLVAANTSRLNPIVGTNWLAVGDAAVAFDPLSSQGIYKALASGIQAGQAIGGHFDDDTKALAEYARALNVAFDKYISQRTFYYRMETRWPNSTFWLRRHSAQSEYPTR